MKNNSSTNLYRDRDISADKSANSSSEAYSQEGSQKGSKEKPQQTTQKNSQVPFQKLFPTDVSATELKVRRVILVEGLANIIVLAFKLAVGISSGSLAVLSDAVHSLTDVANNIVAWSITRYSFKPPDRDHPYGHRKFETLAVFFLATLLTILAFQLVLHVFQSDSNEVQAKPWEIITMLGVLLVNISVSIWERIQAKSLNSDILLADASHTFSDAMTTVAVIIGWLLSSMGHIWVDKLCALAVAGLVFYLAYELFKKASPILVDEFAFEPEKIISTLRPLDEIKSITKIRSRYLGQKALLDLSIAVDPKLSVADAHTIIVQAKQYLIDELGEVDISIRIEPFDENPPIQT